MNDWLSFVERGWVFLFDAGVCEGVATWSIGPHGAPWVTYSVPSGVGAPQWVFFLYLSAFIVVTSLGVVVGYHRMLTHRSVKFVAWLERGLVLAGLYAGTPVQWVGNHRHHHGVTDTARDPHAPSHVGFWTAHAGWYLDSKRWFPALVYTFAGPFRTLFDAFWRPRTNQEFVGLAPDVAKDRFYAFLSRPFGYALVLLGSMAFHLAVVAIGWGAGTAVLFAAMTVVFYSLGDLVNSVGHAYRRDGGLRLGRARFSSNDLSLDSHTLAIFSFGDGYHNGHHAFPFSARAGLMSNDLDIAWWFIRVCEKLGLASDVRLPSAAQLAAKSLSEPSNGSMRETPSTTGGPT